MATASTNTFKYTTTRPKIPLTTARPTLQTSITPNLKIQLRPFQQADLENAHRLRTQQVVMVNTSTGVIDESLEKTQNWMSRFLPPNDATTLDLMLWAQQDDHPWEHIGCLGVHILTPVPHIGYMLRREWWGKSIATKAVQLFLDMWWSLERADVVLTEADVKDEHELHIMKLEAEQLGVGKTMDGGTVPEIIVAEIEQNNIGSVRVVERCGFQLRSKETVVENAGTFVLLDYVLCSPSK